MKANELRIGNYIQTELDEKLNFDYLTQVKEIHSGEILIQCNEDSEMLLLIHAKPVELTEEWLIKFGFKEDRGSFFIKLNEYQLKITKNCFSDYSWWFSINTGYGSQPYTMIIKYVHQLQNLYFALTEKELEYVVEHKN